MTSAAASFRQKLDHPIVDADGHIVESLPALVETLRKLAGSEVADRFGGASKTFASRSASAGAKVAACSDVCHIASSI